MGPAQKGSLVASRARLVGDGQAMEVVQQGVVQQGGGGRCAGAGGGGGGICPDLHLDSKHHLC